MRRATPQPKWIIEFTTVLDIQQNADVKEYEQVSPAGRRVGSVKKRSRSYPSGPIWMGTLSSQPSLFSSRQDSQVPIASTYLSETPCLSDLVWISHPCTDSAQKILKAFGSLVPRAPLLVLSSKVQTDSFSAETV